MTADRDPLHPGGWMAAVIVTAFAVGVALSCVIIQVGGLVAGWW